MNALSFVKAKIDNGKWFQTVSGVNQGTFEKKSNLGRGTSLCRSLFLFVQKLNMTAGGAEPLAILYIIIPLLYSSFDLSGRISKGL